MTESFYRELENCPALMSAMDIASVFRISPRGAYRMMGLLEKAGKAFRPDGEWLQASRADVAEWLDGENY